VTDRLRAFWDFDDLDATGSRFRTALEGEASDEGRAEVLTQLARLEGLRGNVDAGERLVREAQALAGPSTLTSTRIDLERGRLRRSAGRPGAALPLFESAYATAHRGAHWFLAADAAHMAALASPDDQGFVVWTELGIAVAEEHEGAAYWAGPLLNNLGWRLLDNGEPGKALDAFERALTARERDPGNPAAIAIARYAVGRALRILGRSDDAIPLLEQAVAWATGEGQPDGWFHEELAEEHAALGHAAEAAEHARVAIPLLEAGDPAFTDSEERAARLRALAAGTPTTA